MRRIDDLQLNGLRIIQESEHFCFGTDAVALANFAVENSFINMETKICDFCTGNGIIPLLIAGKTDSNIITGIEIQAEVAALAVENVGFNGLGDRINIIQEDVHFFAQNQSKQCGFDIITCNPPYKKHGSGINPKNQFQNIARNEVLINLEGILASANKCLREKGKLFMVHKPERLAEIAIMADKYNLATKRLQMVHKELEKTPVLVLIELQKSATSGMIIAPPRMVQ